MTWTNAFAIGPCTVILRNYFNGPVWTGTLGLGESSPTITPSDGMHYVISVDGSGVVSLNSIDATVAAYYTITVQPPTAIAGFSARARALTINGPGTFAPLPYAIFATGQTVNITGDASVWTPDPAGVTSAASPQYVGVFAGSAGS